MQDSPPGPGRQATDARPSTILVVDDEPAFQETIARYLAGYRRLTAYNASQALAVLARHHVDLVLLDLRLPDMTGLELLGRLRADHEDLPVLGITSHVDLSQAVACTKAGAFDFLPKCAESYEVIGIHIDRALADRQRRRSYDLARLDDGAREAIELLERTTSSVLADALQLLRQVAPTPISVLLEGESGTGKELLARYVHLRSPRAERPFVAISMAAIPSNLLEATLCGHEKGAFTSADRQRLGKFQIADGGTLFLDEIGDLELAAQAKLLRALQEREVERLGAAEASPVDVRVIAATNRRLEAEVAAGRFREDLWYRLNVVRVTVPPLRQRRGDIPELAHLLVARHARALGREPPLLSEDVLGALAEYVWPGNVRELENLIMRLVAVHPGRPVRLADIPVEFLLDHLGRLALRQLERDGSSDAAKLYNLAREHFERYLVRHMIERCGGNKAEAARRLGVSYSTIKNKTDGDDEEGIGA